MMGWSPQCYISSLVEICPPVPEIFEGFLPYTGVVANWPSWSCDPGLTNKFSFPLHTKFRGNWPAGSTEEDFRRILLYMGVLAILVM